MCPISTGIKSIAVRVFGPGKPVDANNSLIFCSPNQTRTVTIPGIPFNADHCDYHYKYDWLVPAGWSVVPTNSGDPYEVISGGIRSFTKSVNVTPQSTALAQGYSGNYMVRVRTEPLWPWPMESYNQVWIGGFNDPVSISGPSSVCTNQMASYSVSPPLGTTSYVWTWSSGWNYYGGQGTSNVILLSPGFPTGGAINVKIGNICNPGGGYPNSLSTNVMPCYSYSITTYPNPAAHELTVKVLAEKENETLTLQEPIQITLFNEDQEVVYSTVTDQLTTTIPLRNIPNGSYILNVQNKEGILKKQILISH